MQRTLRNDPELRGGPPGGGGHSAVRSDRRPDRDFAPGRIWLGFTLLHFSPDAQAFERAKDVLAPLLGDAEHAGAANLLTAERLEEQQATVAERITYLEGPSIGATTPPRRRLPRRRRDERYSYPSWRPTRTT